MPTYEYACTSCGHRFEAHQSFSDNPLTTCPECGAALRKVFGSVGIVLKGPGFYRTDSRNGSSTSRPSKETGAKEPGSKDAVAEKSASDAGGSGSGSGSSSASSSASTSSNGTSAAPSNGSSGAAAKTAAG